MNETLPGIVSSVNTDTYRDYVHIPRLKYDTRNHLPHHASVIIPIFNACTILFDDSLPATNAQPNVLRVHVILLRRYQPPRTYVRTLRKNTLDRKRKGEKRKRSPWLCSPASKVLLVIWNNASKGLPCPVVLFP